MTSVAYLGEHDSLLYHYLNAREQIVPVHDDAEWLISYNYPKKLLPDVLSRFNEKAINLHISLLPWNRGADPNLWSWIDGTPKGVSVHIMDHNLDTGPILLQRRIQFNHSETLRSSYLRLQIDIQQLFISNWDQIKAGYESIPQEGQGSYHRTIDGEKYKSVLANGWDTTIEDFLELLNRHELPSADC